MPTRLLMFTIPFATGCAADRFEKQDGVDWLVEGEHRPGGADDTGDAGSLNGAFDDTGLTSPIAGIGEVELVVSDCTVMSTLTGEQCPGCDLAWTITLRPIDASCTPPEARVGTFSLAYGSAYFNDAYWGAATYSGGFVSWHSNRYTSGASGGWQLHTGYAFY